MATSEFVTLTSVEKPEVVVARLSASEFNKNGIAACEKRVNAQLNRTDLRAVTLIKANAQATVSNLSFREYLKESKRPTLFFVDILSTEGVAQAVREQSASEFEREGGMIRVLSEV